MYNLAIDEWRRRRRRPEILTEVEPRAQPDGTDALNLRRALVDALGQLPPRQRAVLVLRYWEGCSVDETARLLGSSVSTVTSSATRGLARLREVVSAWSGENTRDWNGVRS
jgi:RNA polymerase sigma factor (sigma-70 family)